MSLARCLLGPELTAAKLRLLLWVGTPALSLDLVTKLVAVVALSAEGVTLWRAPAISLRLLVNETLVAAPALAELEAAGLGPSDVLLVLIATLAGALSAFPFVTVGSRWARGAIIAAALLLPQLAIELVPPLPDVGITYRDLLPLRIASSFVIGALVLRAATDLVLVAGVALVLAGNAGNALGLAIEPRGVIDFIEVPLVGPWVFNVADVAITAGVVLFILGALRGLVAMALARWRRAGHHREPE